MAASSALGADVPACIASRTQFGSGVGDELQTTELDLKGQPILLLNPLVPCPTGPVFQGWDGVDRGALNPLEWRAGRNDLDNAATAICPEIGDVMTLLRAQLPVLARMSGSGATCFALFDSDAAMKAAAGRIWDDHPDWWMLAGHMR